MRMFIRAAICCAAAFGIVLTNGVSAQAPITLHGAVQFNDGHAFNRALEIADGDQAHRSRHHHAFLEPDAADVVLADDCKWLRERLTAGGVPADAIARHLAVLGNKDAMEAALAWYRARGAIRGPLGPTRVPTLYIWGDADDTVGRIAAEGTVDFVAAPYRFEVLPGVGHFAADQAPGRVSELLLEQVAAHPI